MVLKNPLKLEKLQISVYKDSGRNRTGVATKTIDVMFNPASLTAHYANSFSGYQGINTSSRSSRFALSLSDRINLELVLDSTGASEAGLMSFTSKAVKSVAAQIQEFLEHCVQMDGSIHEPKYLIITWGDSILKQFDCRIESLDIEYTGFEPNGSPNHAILKATFIEDLDPEKRLLSEGTNSPDLTHSRIVKSGDTLPLLAKAIYGSSAYYLLVAQFNGLDNFRNLKPGQELVFPPLDTSSNDPGAI